MDRGTWKATVHGMTKSWTQLSDLQKGRKKEKEANSEALLVLLPVPLFAMVKIHRRLYAQDYQELTSLRNERHMHHLTQEGIPTS